MNHTPWVLLDTESNGITAPIYAVEIGAQKMHGWLPDGPPVNSKKFALKSMAKKVSCLRFSALHFGPIHAFKQDQKNRKHGTRMPAQG